MKLAILRYIDRSVHGAHIHRAAQKATATETNRAITLGRLHRRFILTANIQCFAVFTFADRIMYLTFYDGVVVFSCYVRNHLLTGGKGQRDRV